MTEEQKAERVRVRRAGVYYALVVFIVIQMLVGVIGFVVLKHAGEEAAKRAAEKAATVAAVTAARTQAQAICPLVSVFLMSYKKLEEEHKLTDAGRVVRDQMQSYADTIGCPPV